MSQRGFPDKGVFLFSVDFAFCGPVKGRDVHFYPFCVVYAPNEMGKTYMVEGIVKAVLGRKAGIKMRNGCEYVKVRLLVDGEVKSFDVNGESVVLDEDLLKMSVIRAGESKVELSNLEAVIYGDSLSRLMSAVKEEMKLTALKEELSKCKELEEELSEIERELFLSGDVPRRLFEVEEEMSSLEEELRRWRETFSYLFFKIRQRLEDLDEELSSLQDTRIDGIASLVREYRLLLDRISVLKEEEALLRKEYHRLRISNEWRRSDVVVAFLGMCVSIAGAVIVFFAYYGVLGDFVPWQLVGSVISVLGAVVPASLSVKLKDFKRQVREYEKMYGENFVSVRGDETLNGVRARLESVRGDLKGVVLRVKQLLENIELRFREVGVVSRSPDDWEDAIRGLRERKARLLEEREKLLMRLSDMQSSGVEPLDRISDVFWSEHWDGNLVDAYNCIRDKVVDVERRLAELRDEQRVIERGVTTLKMRLSSLTGIDIDGDMLSTRRAFYSFRDELSRRIRRIKARLFLREDGIRLIEAYRSKAADEVRGVLEGVALPMLQEFADYGGISVHEVGGRSRVNKLFLMKEGTEYSVDELSTGMSEQLYLAVRLGIVEERSKKRGFFLLDDAFQRTDWQRRRFLVKELKEFCNRGWQVIYFTMDYHIRALFKMEGATVIDL